MTLKKFEDYNIVNFSKLGNNWSARFHKNKEDGKIPYVKGPGGILLIADVKKSIPRAAIYLKPEQVEEYNQVTEEINRLKEIQKEILNVKL